MVDSFVSFFTTIIPELLFIMIMADTKKLWISEEFPENLHRSSYNCFTPPVLIRSISGQNKQLLIFIHDDAPGSSSGDFEESSEETL